MHFSELPVETQRFLKNLRPEDLGLLSEGMRIAKATLIVGKFVKWTTITIVGAFLGMAMIGDAVMKMIGWFGKMFGGQGG